MCAGDDATGDTDMDGVCNDADACIGDDSAGDSDMDGFCDDVDGCFGDQSTGDTDMDGFCDDVDLCAGDDTSGDSDADGICDDTDICVGTDADGDTDADGVCDDIDACDGDDATGDTDGDFVCDDMTSATATTPPEIPTWTASATTATSAAGTMRRVIRIWTTCARPRRCEGNDFSGDTDGDDVCDDLDNCVDDANLSQSDLERRYEVDVEAVAFGFRATPTTPVLVGVGDNSETVSLGFDFPLFNGTDDNVRVHTDGTVLFGTAPGSYGSGITLDTALATTTSPAS